MKSFVLFAAFVLGCVQLKAQDSNYDSALAKKLNADDYGMKRYYLVILKTGTVEYAEKAKRDSLFAGHMKNIQKLASENKLVVAGPFGKNDKTYRGIFILNTSSKEEAERMVEGDPAVQAKMFAAEYYPWYGSAALQQTLEIHNKIQKSKM